MTLEELSKTAVLSKDGLLVSCWIQPRASRNAIAGLHGDALKIALTAPPVDGKANSALREFLADELSLPKASVEIVSGLTGRRKTVALKGISLQTLHGHIA
jgi:uncharacterized protein